LAYPSSFDLVTPLHLLPSVDLCTPYLSAISLKENCSPSSRDFKSSIASSIGAMVVELSCVEVHESRRSMMFGGAQGRSGHKPDGHVSADETLTRDCRASRPARSSERPSYGDQIGVTIQFLRIGLQIATLGLNDVIIVIEAQIGLKTLDARSLSMAIVAATTLALRGTSIEETARGGRDGLVV
jgi:hypothetical protein